MRAAVHELLSEDLYLGTVFGLDADRVFPAHSGFDVPNTGYFVVLRWEEQNLRGGVAPIQVLTVWLHIKRSESTDFVAIKNGLKRIKEILESAVHVQGTDGAWLSSARWTGSSADFYDQGYDTITRNAAFEIVGEGRAVG